MPMNYRLKEEPEKPRATGNVIVQFSIVLLVAAGVLAWQTPTYWAHRFIPNVHSEKAHAA